MEFKSPLESRQAGIETVYQTLAVAPALDIASNMYLGRERRIARSARAHHAQAGQAWHGQGGPGAR